MTEDTDARRSDRAEKTRRLIGVGALEDVAAEVWEGKGLARRENRKWCDYAAGCASGLTMPSSRSKTRSHPCCLYKRYARLRWMISTASSSRGE